MTDNFRAIVHANHNIISSCHQPATHKFTSSLLLSYSYSLHLSYQDAFVCNLTNDFILYCLLCWVRLKMIGRRGLEPLRRTSSLWATLVRINKKGIEPFNVIDSFYTTAIARLPFRHYYQLSTLIYHQCISTL